MRTDSILFWVESSWCYLQVDDGVVREPATVKEGSRLVVERSGIYPVTDGLDLGFGQLW